MIRSLGIIALTAALLVPWSAASAETDVHRDARRDVTRVTTDAVNGGVVRTRPDRSNATADIVRFQTTYGRHAVKLTITLRTLPRPARGTWSGGFATITTPDGSFHAVFSRQGAGLDAELNRASGSSQDCQDLEGAVLAGRRAYRVVVPAECLGSPRWVRTGARVGYETVAALPDSWSDDARATGYRRGNVPVLGPRVHAG